MIRNPAEDVAATRPTGRAPQSSRWLVAAACVTALAFGVFLPIAPWYAIAWLVLLPLAFAPVMAVSVIVAVTVLVPWDVQDSLKVIGGPDQPGPLFVDVLMLLGLVRVTWLIIRGRVPFDVPLLLGSIVATVCTAALAWGISRGADISAAGHEWRRVILGVGTFLLAWPLVANQSARRQLMVMMMGVGLALGLWGFAQWYFSVGYTTAGDVGVRGGLSSGQLQGGLYAYPVAVALAWSALVSGCIRQRAAKYLLGAILLLNAICVLLTFERTLLLATVIACLFVVVASGVGAGRRAVKWAAGGAALLVVAAVIAQTEAQTVADRMALVSRPGSDNSFTHRLVESRVIAGEIGARPVTGSGFGATVTWGVPNTFATSTTPFADMGYHWLIWKLGIPAAATIIAVLCWAVLRRAPEEKGEWKALRTGSRASLLALLIIALLFGVFNSLVITAVMGVLVAVCYSGPAPPGPSPNFDPVPAQPLRGRDEHRPQHHRP